MKTLVCPHCHTQVPESASVCTGCGAEVVRGLSRRQRSLVGLAFVAVAFVIFVVFLRAFEVARGVPFLSPPKAEDGLLFFIGLVVIVIFPYMVGKSWLAFFIVPESASSALISINKAAPATEPPLISDKLV